MGVLHFVAATLGAFIFGLVFMEILPGGNDDIKQLMGVAVFIAREVAFCTSSIIRRLEKKNNKSKTSNN